jgi:glycosyltransferase involved in cell wall biosynthesis
MTADVGRKISVCLITYNHVETIGSTLRSILDQTVSDLEVIVSDDCSTDGTWEEILAVARRDTRIHAVRTPKNLGMASNANFAVEHSTREYVALLHHDDLYREDLLEKWGEVLERHPGAAFVFNEYDEGRIAPARPEPQLAECVAGTWLLREHLFKRWGSVVRGTAMIRRSAWIEAGGMRPEFGLLADVDLWMRLAMRWHVGYVPEPVIKVRQQRPSYYPAMYDGSRWSWERQRLLYEIHAANLLSFLDQRTLAGRFAWWRFRVRLTAETARWLAYSVVRRKPDMIKTSADSETPYDLWPLKLFRWAVVRTSGFAPEPSAAAAPSRPK